MPRHQCLCALALACCFSQAAGAQVASEYDVKAAYLYNFARFVEWPEQAGASGFGICVLGRDPFGKALDAAVRGLQVRGATVSVTRLAAAAEARACRVLFISGSEAAQLPRIIDTLAGFGVLTVSDIPMFSQRGGMIEFVSEGKRVRFEVNLASAKEAGLMLSSDLLRVARTVREAGTP